ncbi:MAG TPA: type III polyketide synthase [Aggregatilineaceae bacterium]|nr:type III polyketide synthase [Aggregatilineaceae bacterium]
MTSFLGLATNVPVPCYSQREIFEQLQELNLTTDPRAEIIFEKAGVGFRHTVVERSYFAEERTTQTRNACYFSHAVPLGESTVRACLQNAGYESADVDDLIIVSCTGIDTPGLDLQLAGRLGMRPDLHRTTILGMGCYAAFPGLLRAREATALQPGRKALVLTIELCSLHLQMDESLENMVACALFADGASAALLGTNGTTTAGPRLLDSLTHCEYNTLEHMAFHLTDHGFQMRLSAYVPDLLAADIENFVDRLLHKNQLTRQDIRFWGVHPGSSKILDHVQERLQLTDDDMSISRRVLHDYGNMSSATILFILEQIIASDAPRPGDYGVLMAFGPGLTMESALLQF